MSASVLSPPAVIAAYEAYYAAMTANPALMTARLAHSLTTGAAAPAAWRVVCRLAAADPVVNAAHTAWRREVRAMEGTRPIPAVGL